MKLAADFVSNQELSRVVFSCSIFLYMDDFDGVSLKEHRKGIGRPLNQMERKISPGLKLII